MFSGIDRGQGFEIIGPERDYEADSELVIPCNKATISAIRDFAAMQRLLYTAEDHTRQTRAGRQTRGFNGPYYFDTEMEMDTAFEGHRRRTTALFGGPHTAYKDTLFKNDRETRDRIREARAVMKHGYRRARRNEPGMDRVFRLNRTISHFREAAHGQRKQDLVPFSRYNCWTGAQGIVQYICGLDLGEIHPDLPRLHRAWQAEAWILAMRDFLDRGGHDYTNHAMHHRSLTLAQNPGGVPFMLVLDDHKTNLANIMNYKSKSGEKVHELFGALAAQGKLLRPRPLPEHLHVGGKKALTLVPKEP